MPSFDVKWVFSMLGPLFLLLAVWSRGHTGRWGPRGRTWLIVGVIFCAVAAWLWFATGVKLPFA